MAPGQYTELFFLDEATALAAGHRPCAECSRDRYNAFVSACANGETVLRAAEIDARLYAERVTTRGEKTNYPVRLRELPGGTFVRLADNVNSYLVHDHRLFLWSPAGYQQTVARPPNVEVNVLTPQTTALALVRGYRPAIHESAR